MNRTSIFDRYPQLRTLRGLVPEEIVETEIGAKADEFDRDVERAKATIETCNLNKIFPQELEKGTINLENFLGHWGNVSVEELCKICLIVRYFRPKRILELGTYNGMTTLQMALNAPRGSIVYTLDLPEQAATKFELSKLDWYVSKNLKEKFGTSTGSYFKGRSDVNIVQLLGDSTTFDYSSTGGSFDLIFIDAAHDYRSKSIDSENAFRLINKNGVVIWHDFTSPANPEVTKYIADISIHRRIVHLRNTFLALFWNQK
jgi:predicted O-methyltransferase YrrM